MSWSLDKTILTGTTLAVIGEMAINFATSYQHVYVFGLSLGETGVSARLQPAGIDLALLAFALGNLFLSRKNYKGSGRFAVWSFLLFGLAGTVVANGAYGDGWGVKGILLAAWAPVLLFMTIETGMILLKAAAEAVKTVEQSEVDEARSEMHKARAAKAAETRRRNRELAQSDVEDVPDDASEIGELPPFEDAPRPGLTGAGLTSGAK